MSEDLSSLLEDKLSVLLKDPNDSGVASALSLLTSFGEESLCEVLCFEGGQVCLRADLGIVHRLVLEKGILELVSKEGRIIFSNCLIWDRSPRLRGIFFGYTSVSVP